MRHNPLARKKCNRVRGLRYNDKYITLEELMTSARRKDFISNIDVETKVKVVQIYFNIIMRWILEGYVWTFPMNAGTLSIIKRSIEKRNKAFKRMHDKRVEYSIQQGRYTRIGYHYMIATKGYLFKKGLVFKATSEMRERIVHKVFNEKKDYRYEE